MKVFFNTILWLIAMLALCLSLFTISKVESSKDAIALELKERVVVVEKENAMLKAEVKELRHGIYTHVHKQYELKPFYQGKGMEYQLENDTVLVFLKEVNIDGYLGR